MPLSVHRQRLQDALGAPFEWKPGPRYTSVTWEGSWPTREALMALFPGYVATMVGGRYIELTPRE